MGITGSSSKRKSSSLNKKRSKKSSQVRRTKRSQSIIRKKKSKKLRRHNDSASYSDDDDSRSSVSVSSSSSEDDYRKRRSRSRSRSRTRRDVRVSKKRARRGSSSSESIRDSSHVRKRKGSKIKVDLDTRKKTYKNKRRREATISSVSCSTCGESEYQRPRGKYERKRRDKRDIGEGRSGTKRTRYRSRSCSSCSRCSVGSGHWSEEKLTGETNLRRLRSVITVAKKPDEDERELETDGHKEEIIYDHDDYPSCRSNDSNDGDSKREVGHHSHVTSEKKRHVENVKGEETYGSNIKTTKVTESGNDGGDRYDGSNRSFDGVEAIDFLKGNKCEVSASVGSHNSDDLESILRQKALENLRKFRGGLQTNAKTPADQKEKGDIDMKQSSTAKAESIQSKSHKVDGVRVARATQVVDRIIMPTAGRNSALFSRNDGMVPDGECSKTVFDADETIQIKSPGEDGAKVASATPVVDQIVMPTTGKNSTSSQNDGKIPVRKYGGTEFGAAKGDVIHPPNPLAIAGNPKEKDSTAASAIVDKSKLGPPALWREPSSTRSTLKQVPTSQASPKAKLLVIKSSVGQSATETAHTLPPCSNNNGEKVNDACGSAAPEPSSGLKPTSEEQSSKEQQGVEAKDGSQFEQKTMSVMRGGEMVQVTYKVYIPKKAPALARRQLQR